MPRRKKILAFAFLLLFPLFVFAKEPASTKKKAEPVMQTQTIFTQHALLNAISSALNEDPMNLQQKKKSLKAKTSYVFTVVIDPGHGGKDPGARGEHGIAEKNVVLAIAKRLAKAINRESGMQAVLTRDGDYFLSLRERLKFAREHHADLFIAIHADAYFEKNAAGASIYALSQRGATSEAARWLAQRENYAELGSVDFDALKDRSLMLRKVLIDLAQTTTIEDSIHLGSQVLDALDAVSSLHYKHVEQAPFVVLKSPDIPSILVETGFISNPREERRLSDAVYQEQLSQALCQGVVRYVKKYGVLRVSDNTLSSPPFHSIVRHHLLAATTHDSAHSKINTFIS